MYSKNEAEQVWNGWKQMKVHINQSMAIFSRADGRYFYDQTGKKYLDTTANMLSSSLGHNIPEIKEYIMNQYEQMDSCSLLYETSDSSISYTNKLLQFLGGHFKHIFYANSGSESCDTAIKIAQQYFYNQGLRVKKNIITLEGAYHGSTIAATLISCDQYDQRALGWCSQNIYQVKPPYNREQPDGITEDEWVNWHLNQVETLIQKLGEETIAAIIVEPVQLSNAVATLPNTYFRGLRQLCNKYQILFIADEVATGFGHVGTLFACQKWGVWPDMIMMAKAVTNGVIPFGGVIVTEEIYQSFYGDLESQRELSHGYTTSGNPLGCAAAIATLEYISEHHVLENVRELEHELFEGLRPLEKYEFVEHVDGVGFMCGIKFKTVYLEEYNHREIGAFLEGILKLRGILVYFEGKGKMFITPPLTSTREEVQYLIKIMRKTFNLVEKLLDEEENRAI